MEDEKILYAGASCWLLLWPQSLGLAISACPWVEYFVSGCQTPCCDFQLGLSQSADCRWVMELPFAAFWLSGHQIEADYM